MTRSTVYISYMIEIFLAHFPAFLIGNESFKYDALFKLLFDWVLKIEGRSILNIAQSGTGCLKDSGSCSHLGTLEPFHTGFCKCQCKVQFEQGSRSRIQVYRGDTGIICTTFQRVPRHSTQKFLIFKMLKTWS